MVWYLLFYKQQQISIKSLAFAARYDGKPWVSYINIGSIGVCGEGNTWGSTEIPPTVGEVKANIDIYLKNYKKSQLVANDDMLYYRKPEADVKTLYEYATSKGITLRDDSPLVNSYVQRYLNTWSVSHPQFYNPLYLEKPIIFEPQIYSRSIETMHATYIGYHGYAMNRTIN